MVTDQSPEPKRIGVGAVLGWIWAVLAIIAGIAEMSEGKGPMGFFTAASGFFACPAVWSWFRRAANVEVSGWLKLVLIVGTLIVAGIASGPHREGEASTSVATVPAESPRAPAPAPKILLDIEGNGTKSTEKFTTAASDWDLQWAYNCSNFGSRGNFIISVKDGDGGFSSIPGVNQLGASGSDTEHFHTGGTFYLEVNSECAWHIKVAG